MQKAILRHPAWKQSQPVSRHDIVSAAEGDGLPKNAAAAHRQLTALNGGTQGNGPVKLTAWQPNAVAGDRYVYTLNDAGHAARRELLAG
jgi:hypothetical protein